MQMQAYCVKCRAKREMNDAKAITINNGKAGDSTWKEGEKYEKDTLGGGHVT